MKHIVTAVYHVVKEIAVEVPDDGNPRNPCEWLEVEDLRDLDCQLYDVLGAREAD